MNKNIKVNSSDIKMFYTLLNSYDRLSNNIGVVRSQKWFDIFTRTQITFYKTIYKKDRLKIIKNKNSCHIFIDDREISYIRISTTDDLLGHKFYKYF